MRDSFVAKLSSITYNLINMNTDGNNATKKNLPNHITEEANSLKIKPNQELNQKDQPNKSTQLEDKDIELTPADKFFSSIKNFFIHTRKQLIIKLIIVFVVLLLFAFDFISKAIIRPYALDVIIPFIPGLLQFIPTHNDGVAFSIAAGGNFALVATISAISIFIFLIALIFVKRITFVIACALIFLGGLANFIDRLIFGYVLDFLQFPFIDNFVFNFADCMVTCGVIILVFGIVFYDIILPFTKNHKKRVNSTATFKK